MKKSIALLLILVLIFCCACDSAEYADVTPRVEFVEGVCIQRTNVEDGKYTYFEKKIDDPALIAGFCEQIDHLNFSKIDPQKFSSADFLIIYEGKKEHKMYVSGNKIMYNDLAYEAVSGDLIKKISELYNKIDQQETAAESRLFK
ncbi:MAG: hypothetical protein IJN42_03435 [Clostridia bacterium]|nr:hypothetical protein [Clostridia bacterium]